MPLPKGNERILVVDDEPALLALARNVFERLGYEVHVHGSVHEALVAFIREPHLFDLVITDMEMPECSGDELARKLVGLRPGIPVILCSGGVGLGDSSSFHDAGIRACLRKPVSVKDLAETVRSVLDRD